MKRYINVFFLIFLTISIAFGSGPKGNSLARAKNDHSGNKIRTTFYNYGLVGRWTSEPEDIGGEWPINSGHEYIGCLLYTSPSPRDGCRSRMPSSA